MDDGSITLLAALIILVAFSAFFSASETAFSSLNQIRLKSRAEDGDSAAARVLAMSEKYDKLLSTILIGNNIVNIAAASIGTVLFTDDLYTKISKNAIDTANALKKGLAAKGYRFFMDSPTNQVFVILDNAQLAALEGRAKFGFWEKFDDTHTVVRIATSWATRMEEIEQLIALM